MSEKKKIKRELEAVWDALKKERRTGAKAEASADLAATAERLAQHAADLAALAARLKDVEAAPPKPKKAKPAKVKAKRKAKPADQAAE